ncbi:MAG: hypothetical protein Q4D24_12215 [Erysipelotrichaceae bacterium]|nr:hypothetical protein [Erysipelotrichaceae bacterium]
MEYFGHFYLDQEKDMIVILSQQDGDMFYELKTPNHRTGNLITNLARLCDLPLSRDENGLKVIRGQVPAYIDAYNRLIYIFRMGNTKIANIYPDGTIEMKASIPSISKTLMSQTKDYRLSVEKTIVKTYILEDVKFRTDLHTHMNANLPPDILIALGIFHQIRYPLYYVKKLGLRLSREQERKLSERRNEVSQQFAGSDLEGKYLTRKIDDNTFINFADLILNDLPDALYNIARIRTSLAVMKDGQAVFTNLEKVYLYRYVFTKGIPSDDLIVLHDADMIGDREITQALRQMIRDHESPDYAGNTLFQDKLLWIARGYAKTGVSYCEISDTTLVKKDASVQMLKQVHEVMPKIFRDTGVRIRFLAAIRRIPLMLIRDQIDTDYLHDNLRALRAVSVDPYVAGCDFVGEEMNDIRQLQPVIRELVRIAADDPTFVIRIHAGENDSLKDNVANSIRCVAGSLAEGQRMPHVRIGHGLYTANLRSEKGKQLLADIRKYNVVLEFQITSNVRLNNLSSLKKHPLKQYLHAGVSCVQGTDGGALYGTDSIDEQLSLEKMLDLDHAEMKLMREAEKAIALQAETDFVYKTEQLERLCAGRSVEEVLNERMAAEEQISGDLTAGPKKYSTTAELEELIRELPENKLPVVIAGGSFNNDQRTTKTNEQGRQMIDDLLERLDPAKVFFVIGHKLNGYEQYLAERNRGRFEIFAIVPTMLSRHEITKLRQYGLSVRISIEPTGHGLYKSFAYEIFKRRPSVLIAFDGNSAGANLIQEARNGRGGCRIFVSSHARVLKAKAQSIEGYITMFSRECPQTDEILYRISVLADTEENKQ